MDYRDYKALEKIASEPATDSNWLGGAIDGISNWFAKNPNWGRAALYGGGALLGTGLLTSLLGSKNPWGWALPAAIFAGIYGHQKNSIDPAIGDYWNKTSKPWIKNTVKDVNDFVQEKL